MKHYTPDIPKLRIYFSAEKAYAENCYQIKKTVREAVRATLFHERFDHDAEISVTFCGNEHIHRINRSYRDIDRPTDVLSFPMYTKEEIADCLASGEEDEVVELGDVVLSLERAAEQAKELGHSFLHEVAFLTIHSVLHLLGYDHELSEKDDEAQCKAQREIIECLDFPDEETGD